MSPEDRVILIGVTSCPWESDQKLLQQVYQKFLVIPRPNYSSRFIIWTHLLNQYMAFNYQFDTGVMSKISDGYTVGMNIYLLGTLLTDILRALRKPCNRSFLNTVLYLLWNSLHMKYWKSISSDSLYLCLSYALWRIELHKVMSIIYRAVFTVIGLAAHFPNSNLF